ITRPQAWHASHDRWLKACGVRADASLSTESLPARFRKAIANQKQLRIRAELRQLTTQRNRRPRNVSWLIQDAHPQIYRRAHGSLGMNFAIGNSTSGVGGGSLVQYQAR